MCPFCGKGIRDSNYVLSSISLGGGRVRYKPRAAYRVCCLILACLPDSFPLQPSGQQTVRNLHSRKDRARALGHHQGMPGRGKRAGWGGRAGSSAAFLLCSQIPQLGSGPNKTAVSNLPEGRAMTKDGVNILELLREGKDVRSHFYA